MATTTSVPCLSSKDSNLYFILTEKSSKLLGFAEAGTLCFITEEKYLATVSDENHSPRSLEVTMLDSTPLRFNITVDVNIVQILTKQQVELLFAVSNTADRFHYYLEKISMEDALNAVVGQRVKVVVEQNTYPAIIHYIGNIHDSFPLLKVFFGVELQGDGEGKGKNDGTYNYHRYFSCKRNCGLFVPFSKIDFQTMVITPAEGEKSSKASELAPVKCGDKVGVDIKNQIQYGTVVGIENDSPGRLVHLYLNDRPKEGLLKFPMDCIFKEEVLSPVLEKDCGMDFEMSNQSSTEPRNGKPEAAGIRSDFMSVNSMVQLNLENGNPASGIIRWTGYLPDIPHMMAGVELDEDKGFTDGTWKGKRYFDCPPKRAIFVKQQACRPDVRFHFSSGDPSKPLDTNVFYGSESYAVLENQPPLMNGMAVHVLKGKMKGIQGHCNSCYMDAALFSLFSCTSVLDSMLFKPAAQADVKIQKILRSEIVNPLRQKGFVSAKSVMKLRNHLTQESNCPSFETSEKDPEEFLNLIMHHILAIDPLLKLQLGEQKEQDCYCYQIFMEIQEELVLPDVQQLVAHSFLSSDLKLAEIPSCFIIQMPRFGKEYKMFKKIIPSLELDITDLLFESPRECIVCGELATLECPECFKDSMFANSLIKQYCDICGKQVHSHQKRKGHKTKRIRNPASFKGMGHTRSTRIPREKMELFAVLCIETSHYVSFVKYGPEKENWMFFDSMADRHDDHNGSYNIPMVTLCPEVAKYLESPVAELAEKRPKEMEGVAKRLFCDAYMYMYQNKKMALYK